MGVTLKPLVSVPEVVVPGAGSQQARGSQRHPLLKLVDIRLGQLLLRRHLRLVEISDRADQQALVRLAGHDSRPRVTSFKERVSRREPQAPFLFLIAMATDAMLDEERTNLLFEEFSEIVGGDCETCAHGP